MRHLLRTTTISVLLGLPLLPLTGCSQQLEEFELISCNDPRPEICTMEYMPVIGVKDDGSEQQYSNGCSACSDPAVTGFRPIPLKKD